MLLGRHMSESGNFLFRWRSYALLVFLPLIYLAVAKAEPIERAIGSTWGGLYEAGCILLVVVGLAVRVATVGFAPAGTSGRNTRGQVAKALNTTGLYSLTRNPLYLGNSIAYLGVMLYTQDLLLSLAFALFLALYYERIILAEEDFLRERFGDAYTGWAASVPAFWPRLHGWVRPALPFSLRSVLRREYPTWFGAVVALAVIDMSADAFGAEQEGPMAGGGVPALALAAVIYLALHLASRRTRMLRVPGR